MANLHDCLQRAVSGGELDDVRGREAQNEYKQLVERYIQAMPRHQAEATAARDLKEATQRGARSRRHMVLNQLQSMRRIRHYIETADDLAIAMRHMVERSPSKGGSQSESIPALADALIGSINAELNAFLKRTGPDLLGNSKDLAMLKDVVDELHLTDTGNAQAKAFADAIRSQQTRTRQMFNAHGGDIGDLADYGAPHSHDAARIRKVGFRAWADDIADKIDWARTPDRQTGKPFADAQGGKPDPEAAERFLKDVFDGIVTRGWDDREPAMTLGGKALYNRHAEHRALHFKTGRDWFDYNQKYGTSDPFGAIMGGLHGLAQDIAQMRVLGPNPKMGLEYATQVAKKRAALSGDPELEARVAKSAKLSMAILDEVSGAASRTAYEASARFFSNTRKVLTSVQLGSAAISSVTDLATLSTASMAVGMNPGNVLSRHVQLMASKATRETAARMGYVAETMANSGAAAARWTSDVMAGQVAERLSGFTIRASGLSYWTDMAKTAWRMEFAGYLADNANRAFNKIDDQLREILSARGITAADWEHLRDPKVLFRADNGATFLSPHYFRRHTDLPPAEADGLALRLQMVIEETMSEAVISNSNEFRALARMGTDPGSPAGVLLGSVSQYKGFGVTLLLNQYRHFMALPTPMAKVKYAATAQVGLLLLGALALQLKELSKGRDPRPMDDTKFWAGAAFQGGGFGIFGDFFASETNRMGGGIAETLAGPVVGLAGDIVGPIASNVSRAAEGKDTLIGRDVSNLLRYNTPVASSLWQVRTAYDRGVADTIQSFLDPDAEQQWRQQSRRRAREYGTQDWWSRGTFLPDRTPNLSNALGGQP